MAMTSETNSVNAYEAKPRGLLLRLYPRWSGTTTRKPASASDSICLCHPYQNSGKPCRSTTTGLSFRPERTACKVTLAFRKHCSSRVASTEPEFIRERAGLKEIGVRD